MEIGGLLNNRHGAGGGAHMGQQMHPSMHMNDTAFGQLSHLHHNQNHLHQYGDLSHTPMQPQSQSQIFRTNYEARQQNLKQETPLDDEFGGPLKPKSDPAPKPYACSDPKCGKSFARRSDLARHERIHSNDRPHACDHPGCGKEFIQRSALTVHYRTHTGEKPHACETCDKRFSDSSSLARHRRIHSGQRPYRCPHKECQKNFTRKTTLNRHYQTTHRNGLDGTGHDLTKLSTSTSSRSTTTSPGERTESASPIAELPSLASMQHSGPDHGFLPQPSLPPHLRTDFQTQFSPRSTPSMSGPSLASFTSNPQSKASPTSHPNAYGPPQPLEPPANGTASGSASPHMGPLSWGSPTHGTLPSPSGLNYDFSDGGFGSTSFFYPPGGIRRPQSTEPQDYGIRPRGSHAHSMGQGHPQVSMPLTRDWSTMPVSMDIKQEHYVM